MAQTVDRRSFEPASSYPKEGYLHFDPSSGIETAELAQIAQAVRSMRGKLTELDTTHDTYLPDGSKTEMECVAIVSMINAMCSI